MFTSRQPIAVAFAIALSSQTAAAQDCIVTSQAVIQVGAEAKGILAKVLVDRGDTVKAGDLLAELEAAAERAVLAQAQIEAGNDVTIRLAQARAAAATVKVARLEKLAAKKLIPQSDLDEARLEADVATLEIEQATLAHDRAQQVLRGAEAALNIKTIRSPFDATVTDRLMHPGELYTEQSPILTLARTSELYVETVLPFERLDGLARGQKVDLTLQDGRQKQAEILVIDPVLDPATSTFGLRLTLDNPDRDILAGTRCMLTFD